MGRLPELGAKMDFVFGLGLLILAALFCGMVAEAIQRKGWPRDTYKLFLGWLGVVSIAALLGFVI